LIVGSSIHSKTGAGNETNEANEQDADEHGHHIWINLVAFSITPTYVDKKDRPFF
jgi:hypothetical protein